MSDKTQLLEAFDRLKEAMFANDVETLDQLMAEEYVGYDPSGNPQDKALSLDAYSPGNAELDKYDVKEVDARVIGEVGIITGKGYIHGTFAGAEFEHDLRFLDLYIHRDGRWQLYLSQVTPLGAG